MIEERKKLDRLWKAATSIETDDDGLEQHLQGIMTCIAAARDYITAEMAAKASISKLMETEND